jgi:two-component system, response regulator PdtaR
MPRDKAALVLVVEDEFFIAMELEATLAAAGYEVLGPAVSVGVAFELLNDRRPDAAVLDVNLGDHRVTPVAQELVALSIPYVIASAYSARDLENEPLLSKVVNLGKPTLPERLLFEIGRLVSSA